jgi:hypothetical protein
MFGDIEYDPSVFTRVLDDHFVRNAATEVHAKLFKEEAGRYDTPAQVRVRNIEPLVRHLEKCSEFQDAVKVWRDSVRIDRSDRQAYLVELFTSTRQLSIYEAVREEFGLPMTNPLTSADVLPGVRMVVRAVYNRTQLFFARRKVKLVELVRGEHYTQQEWELSDFCPQNPLPYQRGFMATMDVSFAAGKALRTLALYHARPLVEFQPFYPALMSASGGEYGALFAGIFPVERILSTAFTGWGSLLGREYVLLGGPMLLQAKAWRADASFLKGTGS